jgi:hypothetical protein
MAATGKVLPPALKGEEESSKISEMINQVAQQEPPGLTQQSRLSSGGLGGFSKGSWFLAVSLRWAADQAKLQKETNSFPDISPDQPNWRCGSPAGRTQRAWGVWVPWEAHK